MGKRKNDNKGFTLVELIVVITILGILAAMMIPALLGYIDKAKGQQIVLNGKSVLTAAQADMSAAYAKNMELTDSSMSFTKKYKDDILKTADVSSAEKVIIGTAAPYGATQNHAMYTVNYVYYQEGGKGILYDGKSWDEQETAPTKADLESDTEHTYFVIK